MTAGIPRRMKKQEEKGEGRSKEEARYSKQDEADDCGT
jgi:hypothetical protein